MFEIDKNMYKKLKNWCDWSEEENRPHNERILYVNSHDRALTNATIRKMMFEMEEEDIEGELYIDFYSAENFYRNLREYYLHISELYRHKTAEDDNLIDIIENLPPTCGWIVLIVEDIELLSGKSEKMQEMMKSIFTFSSRNSSIILVGSGEYKKVFAHCEFALYEMADGMATKDDDGLLKIGEYEQALNPERECVTYENTDDQRNELNFYWDVLYRQLKKRYFDYSNFKILYRETMDYIIPRVTLEQIYRKDISIVENIGLMRRENSESLDGCTMWEFDAAQQFSVGLHTAIINRFGYHDDLSGDTIGIDVLIKEAEEDFGAIHSSGYTYTEIKVNTATVLTEIDKISDLIHECTYMGDSTRLWKYLMGKQDDKNGDETVNKDMEEVYDNITSLMDDIKEAAERTVNRKPGRKVRRYKGQN